MEQQRLNEFIYNFLVNASQMAYIEEAHGTLMLLENFNELFRYVVRSEKSVTLFNELEVLSKYIIIQQMRYGDRFAVHFTNDVINKSIFIKPLSVVDFFDSILYRALEQYEHFMDITLDFEISDYTNIIVVLEVDDQKEISYKKL